MNPQSTLEYRAEYYDSRYEVVAYYQFESGEKTTIADQVDVRTCRYCARTSPDATFRKVAHAIPQFLGNNSVFTLDECDACNARLASEYEDHLAKWSHMIRSILKIRGKNGTPIFKNESLRLESDDRGLHITYYDPSIERLGLEAELPFELQLQGDKNSQSHIPIKAAMALVRIAVSICPFEHLHECAGAIQWLQNPTIASISEVRVMHAFTPGLVPREASHAILLRRKVEAPCPYLWLVLQCRNFRLQMYVPFCQGDKSWWATDESITIAYVAYPSIFDSQWSAGPTQYGTLDWTSAEIQRTAAEVTFQMETLRKLP